MRELILFIPSRPYRSDPSFIQICAGLKEQGYQLIYIDFNGYTHQFHTEIDEQGRKRALLRHFEEVTLLDGRKYELKPSDNKLLAWRKIRSKARLIKKTLKEINPSAVIISFNQGVEFNSLIRVLRATPLFFLQTVALNAAINQTAKVSSFRRFVYNMFDINIYAQQKIDDVYYFFWANKTNGEGTRTNPANAFYLGNSLFDSILKSAKKPGPGKWYPKSIAYLSQPTYTNDEESKVLLHSFIGHFVKNSDYSLKVLVHPRDNPQFFSQEFSQYQPVVRYSSQFDSSELADTICITYSSVYGQELIARGIPVIIINPQRKRDYAAIFPPDYPFVISATQDIDTTQMAINKGEFQKIFWEMREDFFKQVNTYADGNSTQRIVDKITEIMSI